MYVVVNVVVVVNIAYITYNQMSNTNVYKNAQKIVTFMKKVVKLIVCNHVI